MAKYERLAAWLRAEAREPRRVSFGQLETVLGFRLSPSYREHLAPWYGSGASTIGAAIAEAGWRARGVDLTGETLVLEPRSAMATPATPAVGETRLTSRGDGDHVTSSLHASGESRPPTIDASPNTGAALPFVRYPAQGRQFLGKPPPGDLTARKGYGPPVFKLLGHRCAYCAADLTRYESWLGISVDHVLPQQLTKVGWRKDWLLDRVNLVPCCRACNEFTNSYKVPEAPPSSPKEFFDLRDRHFELKRAMAAGAHERERAWHGVNVASSMSVRELLAAYRDSLTALRARGVIRSPKVVADYAEWLAVTGLKLELAERGAERGYDAVDPDTGDLYQVKARQVVPPYNQPDLRGGGLLEPKPFDYLIGVLLDVDYGVALAAKIPYEVVRDRARRIEYTNGYRFHLGSSVMALPEVVNVTAELKAAAAS